MKSVFLDYDTVSNGDIDESVLTDVLPDMRFFGVTAADDLVSRVADAEIVLTNKIAIGADTIAAAPKLKLICLAATGTNNVDLEAAGKRSVGVCNISAYCTDSVVQHVFSLILSLNQHLSSYQKLLQDGAWRDSPQFCLLHYPIRELRGQMLGIIGYGELGRGAAAMGKTLGMNVLVSLRPGCDDRQPIASQSDKNQTNVKRITFDEMLERADVISIHCPLTADTEKLFAASEFRRMKDTALLINTARGAIIDEQALADALRAGEIGGAGIDVLSEEPPVNGNPLLDATIPNLIVTPHIAWAAGEARQRAVDEMAANLKDFIAGGTRGRVV